MKIKFPHIVIIIKTKQGWKKSSKIEYRWEEDKSLNSICEQTNLQLKENNY